MKNTCNTKFFRGNFTANFFFAIFSLFLFVTTSFAQIVSTTPGAFNYGTGLVSGNTAPFNATSGNVTVSGNDVTITGNVSILTGSTTTSGIYNFHNFTVNAGATVTISGTSPLVIRCTGTATINGTISAVGGNGGSNFGG